MVADILMSNPNSLPLQHHVCKSTLTVAPVPDWGSAHTKCMPTSGSRPILLTPKRGSLGLSRTVPPELAVGRLIRVAILSAPAVQLYVDNYTALTHRDSGKNDKLYKTLLLFWMGLGQS